MKWGAMMPLEPSPSNAGDNSTPKCARCSARILDGDLVVRQHDEWYHVRCRKIQATSESVRRSAAFAQEVRRVIDAARATLRQSDDLLLREMEAPAVVCALCEKAITAPADLLATEAGPIHRGCRQKPDAV